MGVPMVVGAAVRQMLAVTQARFGVEIRLHVDRESRRGMGRHRDGPPSRDRPDASGTTRIVIPQLIENISGARAGLLVGRFTD